MFLSCTLQGQELKRFVVWKTGEKQQKSRNGAFEEETYVMPGEAASLCELAVPPLGPRSQPGFSHLMPALARLTAVGDTWCLRDMALAACFSPACLSRSGMDEVVSGGPANLSGSVFCRGVCLHLIEISFIY